MAPSIEPRIKQSDTVNELQDDESYAHITEFQPISQLVIPAERSVLADIESRILMADLRRLRGAIKPSNTPQGDGMVSPHLSWTKLNLLQPFLHLSWPYL